MENVMLHLRRLVGLLLRVQPGEGRKVSLMSALMFCLVGYYITGRVARDSLFLSRYSIDYLPVLYIWVALGVSLQSYFYSRVADRVRRDRLLFLGLTAVLSTTVLARLLLCYVGDWFYPVLYVFVELTGTLLVIQGWTLANDVFTTREGKRLFGLVGAGGVISSVVLGLTVRWLVTRVGTENLLLLAASLLVGGLVLLAVLSRHCRHELIQALVAPEKKTGWLQMASGWQRFFGDRQLAGVASIAVLVGVMVTLVDYQFKLAARQAFPDREAALAAFLGGFWAVTGAISCGIQFFITSRLLEHRGILFGLLLLPLSLLGSTAAILVIPVLFSVTLLKGADAVFRYTIHDASFQLLYLPLPATIRGRAKAFVDGMLRPLAIGLSGASLFWLTPGFPSRLLNWVMVLLLFSWLGFAIFAHRNYYRSLAQTLKTSRFRFDEVGEMIPDEAAAKVLSEALHSPEETTVMQALEMLRLGGGRDWSAELRRLLNHGSAAVRERALRKLVQIATLADGPVVFGMLKDESATVRAAAVEVYCAIGKSRAIKTISRYLRDPAREVQAAALVGLIRYGGLDGVLVAAERLKALLESTQAEERALGAHILGDIGVRNFYHPLIALLVDEDLGVRLEAIKAAGKMQSPELLPALVYRLAERTCRVAAAEALAACGERAVRVLSRTLANDKEPLATRVAAANILARIGGQTALDALAERIAEPLWTLRGTVFDALHRLLLHAPHLGLPSRVVNKVLNEEIKNLARCCFFLEKLVPPPGELLREALLHEQAKVTKRLFRLLGFIHPQQTIDLIFRHLNSSSRRLRANAMELLDGLLDRELKRVILPLLDESLADERKAVMEQLLGAVVAAPEQILRQLIASQEPWLTACSLYETSSLGRRELLEDVLQCTASEHPLVRETALLAAVRLADREQTRRLLERHMNDGDVQVRMLARHLASISAG